MNESVFQKLESFLTDFQYEKLEGHDVFIQKTASGSKLVVVNSTPYEDGFMLELLLAVRINEIEEIIFDFNDQNFDKLSLTYWESLYQISDLNAKRNFIQNEIELVKVMHEFEHALVKKGFNWLDIYSNKEKLSAYLQDIVFTSIQKPYNFLKICQRSCLLRTLLTNKLTDSDFYEYYENMQMRRLPEHQLNEFLSFKNYLNNRYLID